MDFEILAKSAKIPLFCGKRAIRQMVKICYNLFTTMSFKQFRPGFQQESILLHIGNVENYVENVEIVRLIVLEVFDYVVNGIF